MTAEKEVFRILTEFGYFEVLVPCMVGFAVTWGLLERSKFFGMGKDKERLNLTVALAVGLLAAVVLGQSERWNATMLMSVVGLLAFFSLFFLAGIVFGPEWRDQLPVRLIAIVIAAIIFIVVLGLYKYLVIPPWMMFAFAGIVFFVWVVIYIARGSS